MNRRKMLSVIGLGGLGFLAAGDVSIAQTSPSWIISEEELALAITKPSSSREKKAIVTNRFDVRPTDEEKLIRIAEAIVPADRNAAFGLGDGMRNITSRSVNQYFRQASMIKDLKNPACDYRVSIDRFAHQDESKSWQELTSVRLALSYGYICGWMCCSSIVLSKAIIFNAKGDVVAAYFPRARTIEC